MGEILLRKEKEMVKLGDKVKDSITKFDGIAVAICRYLNGCVSVEVRPTGLDKDGKMKEAKWIDEQQLNVKSKAEAGGPGDIAPSMDTPE